MTHKTDAASAIIRYIQVHIFKGKPFEISGNISEDCLSCTACLIAKPLQCAACCSLYFGRFDIQVILKACIAHATEIYCTVNLNILIGLSQILFSKSTSQIFFPLTNIVDHQIRCIFFGELQYTA